MVSFGVYEFEHSEETRRFQTDVQDELTQIQRRVATNGALVRSAAALFAASQEVTPDEFAAFLERLEIEEAYPSLQTVGFVQPNEGRWTVAYAYPMPGVSEALVGRDLGEHRQTLAALEEAMLTGELAASAPLEFGGQEPVFVLFAPVYGRGIVPDGEEARQSDLAGLIFAVFRGDELLQVAFSDLPPGVGFAVYDGLAPTGASLVYSSASQGPSQMVETHTVEVGGRPWTIEFLAGPEYVRGDRLIPLLIAIVGVLVSFVLYYIMKKLHDAREEAERRAAELHASERRFRDVLDQSPLSTEIVTPDGRPLLVNKAFESLWGLRPRSDRSILDDPQLQRFRSTYEAVFRTGRPVMLPAVEYTPTEGHYAGEARVVSARLYPVKSEDGGVRELVIVHEDVTDRVRTERVLQETQRHESIAELAAGVAHDFNNLLGGIMVGADLAADLLPPGNPARPVLESIVASCERAADLTRQLLAYAGRSHRTAEPVDIGPLLEDMQSLMRSALPKKVALDVQAGAGLAAVGDGAQLRQAILNLVVNAGEAIGDAEGQVAVRAHCIMLEETTIARDYSRFDLAPGPYVQIDVRDTGSGIDEKTRERIFDPFFSTRFVGRGLGLSATLGVVRMHGGGIAVESQPGCGSTFRIVLPRAETTEEVAPVAEQEREQGFGTVLVADDEEVMLEMAEATLKKYGYEVIVASDGHEAVDAFRQNVDRIDLVILDVSMPGLNGVEAHAQIRALRPEVPVLLSSGYGQADVLERFQGAVDGFIAKPYRARVLADAVWKAMPEHLRPPEGHVRRNADT